jgi:hypothetical protein
MVACIQPNLSSGEAVGSWRIPDTKQLAVCTRRFHDAMVIRRLRFWNASKRVGFSGPTMVLSETQGLSLSLVMRGGIWCIWRLGAERLHTGPNSLIDTLPRPRASQEPIG